MENNPIILRQLNLLEAYWASHRIPRKSFLKKNRNRQFGGSSKPVTKGESLQATTTRMNSFQIFSVLVNKVLISARKNLILLVSITCINPGQKRGCSSSIECPQPQEWRLLFQGTFGNVVSQVRGNRCWAFKNQLPSCFRV